MKMVCQASWLFKAASGRSRGQSERDAKNPEIKCLCNIDTIVDRGQCLRSQGRSLFRLAQTPDVFGQQLKLWRRGRVIYRELRARGLSDNHAAIVAGNSRRW